VLCGFLFLQDARDWFAQGHAPVRHQEIFG